MTQLYNLTCYRVDDNETESVTERFNSTVERTIINFNASANVYTCCTSVITQIGDGPVACGKVESLPPGSELLLMLPVLPCYQCYLYYQCTLLLLSYDITQW